ncbi:MAG: PilW family protein [Gammaproteobacteria bacterium]|nr:PilW family protein [Gammaproteobacteria bacterium]
MSSQTNHRGIFRQQRGVTLVELMVALVLGLVLTGGAIQIFVGNRTTYAFNEGLSRLQENGRFAVDTLNYRVRMAGYFGCLPDITVYNNLNNNTALAFDFDNGLQGFEAAGTSPGQTFAAASSDPANGGTFAPVLPAGISGNVIPGSDVIVIRNVSASSHALVSPYNDSAQIFADAEPTDYIEGEIGIVSDCQKASVFQITNIDNNTGSGAFGVNMTHSMATFTPGNSTPNWDSSQEYGAGAELLRAETWIYYVGATADGPPALFQQRLQLDAGTSTVALVAEELVEAVDTMQLLYGIDADGDNDLDNYVTANNVTDWTEVLTVRVGLLMRSPDEYGSEIDTQEYDVNGTTFDPVDDRRVRQVFTTTIALRNRLP